MTASSTPAPTQTSRPVAGKAGALIAILALAAAGCQPEAAAPPPARSSASVAPPPVATSERAVNSLLLQYQDSGALLRNGFQIAEEGGIVAFEQFERWTPIQLRELLQFIESPASGLSDATAQNLGRAVRAALASKRETEKTAPTSKPPAPAKAAP